MLAGTGAPGAGGSVFSFVHSADAAGAVVAALADRRPGVFNIVDNARRR